MMLFGSKNLKTANTRSISSKLNGVCNSKGVPGNATKRFTVTSRGKVVMPQAGKRHGMIKRTNSQIRKQRGTTVMSKQDGKIVKSYMPYSLRG